MRIEIKQEEIEEARRESIEFDKIKTYDKFICKNNYIGLLGEMVFHRYLTEQNIKHTWVDFVKKGWNQPDFIINGITIDLKTTYSDAMWYQQPKFDIYIYAQIAKGLKYLDIKGWADKEYLNRAKTNGRAVQVCRWSRVDNVISPEHMLPMDYLIITGGEE